MGRSIGLNTPFIFVFIIVNACNRSVKDSIYFFVFAIFTALKGGIESRRCCTTDSVLRFCFLLDEGLMRGDDGSRN